MRGGLRAHSLRATRGVVIVAPWPARRAVPDKLLVAADEVIE